VEDRAFCEDSNVCPLRRGWGWGGAGLKVGRARNPDSGTQKKTVCSKVRLAFGLIDGHYKSGVREGIRVISPGETGSYSAIEVPHEGALLRGKQGLTGGRI